MQGGNESGFEKTIGYLLIVGVIISLLLEITGVAMLYSTYRQINISQDTSVFIKGHDFFTFVLQQVEGKYLEKSPFILMTAGIIVLVLTPYIRVLASVLHFAWQRNWKYVCITLFVLIVVTLSLTLH
jgi:uncharacterized membrane protein